MAACGSANVGASSVVRSTGGPSGARMLEAHIALVGDHRPELGLNRDLVQADLEQLRVLERERLLRLGLLELSEGALHLASFGDVVETLTLRPKRGRVKRSLSLRAGGERLSRRRSRPRRPTRPRSSAGR